jgi:hypothetical protein
MSDRLYIQVTLRRGDKVLFFHEIPAELGLEFTPEVPLISKDAWVALHSLSVKADIRELPPCFKPE